MNKKQLVKVVSNKLKAQEKVTNLFLSEIIETIAETLELGEDVLLVDFGKFRTITRKKTKRRNPRTGESFEIPERTLATFKVGRKLKARVDNQNPN